MPKFQLRDSSGFSDREYQAYILQGVSRTFALTIPQLPSPLVPLVENAYLLCRIADTIEDDAALSAEDKRRFSQQFVALVKGGQEASPNPSPNPSPNLSPSPAPFVDSLLPQLAPQTPATEVDLIKNTARVIRVTHSFEQRHRAILSRCVEIMSAGMAHFQAVQPRRGLADLHELNSYCYQVAGVVGEMLTELYCDYNASGDEIKTQMLELSVSFGQGLQMTNILKDVWDDAGRGICWLPREVFLRHGFELEELIEQRQQAGFAAAYRELIAIAHGHLRHALTYTGLIDPADKGFRKFCLWSIGMALLTLKKIHADPFFTRGEQVKISRRQLRTVMLLSNLAASRNSLISRLFNRMAEGLPAAIYTELDPEGYRNLSP